MSVLMDFIYETRNEVLGGRCEEVQNINKAIAFPTAELFRIFSLLEKL
ncbi:MAG: hypothetical protein MUD14_21780 [Hydrococcus sp. Prado102]|nr:hypothetical protein [Hydrococcus sp. Prado102]